MKKTFLAAAIAGLAFISPCLAQGTFNAITNDDNPKGNTATVFQLSGSPPTLTVSQTLHTGGLGLGTGAFAVSRVSVENNGQCLFVSDGGSNDIASFAATSKNPLTFNTTAQRIASGGSGSFGGIGLAATPDGSLLFATLDQAEQIAVFTVGAGCKLSAAGTISENDNVGAMAITRDGNVLIVPEPNKAVVDAFAVSATAPYLSPLGPSVNLMDVPNCFENCYPGGLDISDVIDGKANVVLANSASSHPSYITVLLDERQGLFQSTTALHQLARTTVANVENPWYSSAGLIGNGFVYFAGAGYGFGVPAGVAVNEVTNGIISNKALASYVNPAAYYASDVQSTSNATTQGNEYLWQCGITADLLNTIYVYRVSSTGPVTAYTALPDPNAQGTSFVLSITAFPKR